MDLLASTGAQKASTPLGTLLHTYLKRPAAAASRERDIRPKRDDGARRPPLAPLNGRLPAAPQAFEPGDQQPDDASVEPSFCESEYGDPPPSLESFSPRRTPSLFLP